MGLTRITLIFLLLFSSRVFAETYRLDLSGSWKMVRSDNPALSDISVDDSQWKTVQLPAANLLPSRTSHFWIEDAGLPDSGIFWLRKYIVIDNPPGIELLFQAGLIMNVDRTWLNGVLIGETGSEKPQFRSGWAVFRSYNIPPVLWKKGTNVLAVRVYFNAESSVTAPIEIVDRKSGQLRETLYRVFFNHLMLALTFFFFCVSIFFLIYYIKRPSALEYLYFTLANAGMGLAVVPQFLEPFFPNLSYRSDDVLRFTQSALLYTGPMIWLFVYKHLFKSHSIIRFVVGIGIPVIGTIAINLAPDRVAVISVRNIFLLVMPLFMVLGLIDTIRAVIKKIKRAYFMALALVPLYGFALHDILTFGIPVFHDNLSLFIFGFPTMLLIISIQQVQEFFNNLNIIEKQKRDLEIHQARLESIVKERTVELQEANDILRHRSEIMEKEMQLAERIQRQLMSRKSPGKNYASLYQPMQKIGGDFYDFIRIGNTKKMGIFVSDVSGHGVPAALITAMIKSILLQAGPVLKDPSELLGTMNQLIHEQVKNHFITAFYGVYDPDERTLSYANAGHHSPVRLNSSGYSRVWSEHRGFPLGIMPCEEHKELNHIYRTEQIKLEEGDKILFFTDGLLEATPENGNESISGNDFEKDCFETFIAGQNDVHPVEIVYRLYQKLVEYRGSENFDDDICILCLQVE